jgi:cyclopropane-fatty-acyl-phospholipid synthase
MASPMRTRTNHRPVSWPGDSVSSPDRRAERIGRELLDLAGIEPGGSAPWDIQIHDDRLWSRVLAERELGLGEAYQDGWWDAERVDQFLARVITADLIAHVKASPSILAAGAHARLVNRQSTRRARHNARAHYDIGNDLYERMLDPRMIYSCAYWRDADDLAVAQEAKLELICRKLHLEPGMHVLDIGCGWGGLAEYAASKHGVTVTGISPAIEQVRVAQERCLGLPVEIRQADYRELSGSFDRIVSVGMMEHVGPKNLHTFFETCARLLRPDGIMLHHTIGSNETQQRCDPWFDRYIFPGGVLPSLEQIGRAALHDWVVEDLHNFGPDYDRTLMAWHDNLEAAWADLPHYDERFRRTWRYYLLASAASFRVRTIQLWQVVFTRPRRQSDVYQTVR